MLAIDTIAEDARELCGKLFGRRYRWPLTMSMTKHDDGNLAVFVHETHGAKYWDDWADHPPTWMDPQLFVELALADERVQKILQICYKKNDPTAWKRLLPLFQEVMDEQYLPMMLERFDETAAPLLAQWLIRHHAQQQLDAKHTEPTRRRRRK